MGYLKRRGGDSAGAMFDWCVTTPITGLTWRPTTLRDGGPSRDCSATCFRMGATEGSYCANPRRGAPYAKVALRRGQWRDCGV